MRPAHQLVAADQWRAADGHLRCARRDIAEETAVALVYNGSSHAVMMATPADLEDFAVGFSLSESIIASAGDIEDLEVIDRGQGIEIQMWLGGCHAEALAARRRHVAGITGCGLCGLESLEEAVASPDLPPRRIETVRPEAVLAAMQALSAAQDLNAATRAVHAAAWWHPEQGLVAVREDVGRHNALDKLVGAIAGMGRSCTRGALLITSRVSVEMVQKAARAGCPMLVAVSAPTSLAIATAERADITLIAIARDDGFEIFTRPERVYRDDRPEEAAFAFAPEHALAG